MSRTTATRPRRPPVPQPIEGKNVGLPLSRLRTRLGSRAPYATSFIRRDYYRVSWTQGDEKKKKEKNYDRTLLKSLFTRHHRVGAIVIIVTAAIIGWPPAAIRLDAGSIAP